MEDYIESNFRHLHEFWKEHRDIRTEAGIIAALCGIMFNTMGYLHEYLKDHEMQDFDGADPTPEMKRRLSKEEPPGEAPPPIGICGLKMDPIACWDCKDQLVCFGKSRKGA